MRGARKVITFGSSMGGAHALYLAKDLGSVCIGAIPDNPVIESMRARDFLKRAPYFARDALKMDAKNVFKQKLSPELGLDKLQLAVRIREIGHLMKYLGTVDPKEIADLANPIIVFMGKLDKVLPTLSLFRNHFEKYETGEKKSLTPFGDNVAVGLKGGVRYPGHSWGANNLMDYFSSNIRAILKFVEMDELKEHQKIPIATPMVMQAVSV